MKEITVKVIINNNTYGLTNDATALIKHLQMVLSMNKVCTFKVKPISSFLSSSEFSDINIFLEIPNPLLIHTAKVNILIPNYEWFYNTWIEYLPLFDYIWCKTDQSYNIFSKLYDSEKVVNLGWTSLDRYDKKYEKNFKQFLHLAGNSKFKGTQRLIDNWKDEYPNLVVVYNSKTNTLNEKKQDNIIYHRERISDEKLLELMNTSGVHLCPSETEGFGHYLNEARSCKSVIITTDDVPMSQFSEHPYLIKVKEKENIETTLGIKSFFQVDDLHRIITYINKQSESDLHKRGNQMRNKYIGDQKIFRKKLLSTFRKIFINICKQKITLKIPKEVKTIINELPTISIVTITRNRQKFFPLMLMNYRGIDYPKELLEWIIVDDGDSNNKLEKLIPKDLPRVRYISDLESVQTIGKKRNIGVKDAIGEYIAFMDDDDIYPPRHLLIKLAYLKHYQKNCGYCTNIKCFDINRIISTINVPPFNLCPSKRVSEATLMFKKTFWVNKSFSDEDIGEEGAYFLKDRYSECVEIPEDHCLISLLHNNNTSNRVTLNNVESNGCHFGLNDDLFNYITNIDNEDTEKFIKNINKDST